MKCAMELNQEALELKETHYQELSDALRDFVPLEVRSSKSVKEMEAQLDLTRKQLEEERAEADAKMEAEQVDFEAEQKRKMSAELHEFETELAQEREKEELIEKSKLEELEKRKEELAAERKNRMKQEMEAMEQLPLWVGVRTTCPQVQVVRRNHLKRDLQVHFLVENQVLLVRG